MSGVPVKYSWSKPGQRQPVPRGPPAGVRWPVPSWLALVCSQSMCCTWVNDVQARDTPALQPGGGRGRASRHCPPPCPSASPPAGAAAHPPAEELPGVNGGRRHPCVLRRPPASVPGSVLPSVCHLPHVCAGASRQAKVHHRYVCGGGWGR